MALRVNTAILDKWETSSVPDRDLVMSSQEGCPSPLTSDRGGQTAQGGSGSFSPPAHLSINKVVRSRRMSHSVPPHGTQCSTIAEVDFTSDSGNQCTPQQTEDDISAVLGPGQVRPKVDIVLTRGHVTSSSSYASSGDLKLAFVITKGQFELDVICAKGLTGTSQLKPDTYVKTYLIDGSKRIQKKRTKTIRACVDPFYITKLKYPASNIHGRHMQVLVKEHVGNFERGRCLGEILIRLDNIDLTVYTMGWYRLFAQSLVDLGSSESVHL